MHFACCELRCHGGDQGVAGQPVRLSAGCAAPATLMSAQEGVPHLGACGTTFRGRFGRCVCAASSRWECVCDRKPLPATWTDFNMQPKLQRGGPYAIIKFGKYLLAKSAGGLIHFALHRGFKHPSSRNLHFVVTNVIANALRMQLKEPR